jgi:hypothetical protein
VIHSLAQALQAPQHQRHMASKHAPVKVGFIYDHECQLGQEAGKGGVEGQDGLMQHVGVGQQQLCPGAYAGPQVLRSVPIIHL